METAGSKEMTPKDKAIADIMFAVAYHRYAKTPEDVNRWYNKVREHLRDYYEIVAKECMEQYEDRHIHSNKTG